MILRKALKYVGVACFGIFVFIFFTYLNFPYNKLKDKIFGLISQQSGITLDAGELKTTYTLGLVLTDLEISHASLPPIKIDELKVSPSLFSLMILRPKVNWSIDTAQGDADGFFQTQGVHTQSLGLNIDDFNLSAKALKDHLPIELDGLLNAKLRLKGNLQKTDTLGGETELTIQKFKLAKSSVMNMNLPEISLSKIVLQGDLKQEKFTIQKLNLGGSNEDLEASGSGDITLSPQNIMNSRLNLTIKFKLSKKLEEEFSLFLPFIANALDKDGFYSLNITGRLGAPRAIPKQS